MVTLTFNLTLDEQLAVAYQQARQEEKESIRQLFERLLTVRFRKQKVENMIKLMEEIGNEAEANGLTQEILDEILAEA